MKENHSKHKSGRKFWYRLCAFLLFFFMLCWIICKLNVLTEKVDDNACLNPPTCPSQINAVCVDTLITTKMDPRTKKCVLDTIFQKYYCSQIVVSGINKGNKHKLDSLLNNGFEVVRSCACDSISILGRGIPLTPEERRKTSEGKIVDESGGLGTGLNFIIDLPIPTQIIPDSVNIKQEQGIIEGLWTYNSPSQGNNKVKVAIIDTGIDFGHKYLTDYKWRNEPEVFGQLGKDDYPEGKKNCLKDDKFGYNFADDSPFINDENGHGTHVAGIISKSSNAQLMNLKIFNKEGGDGFSLVCALHYAIHAEADIINMSLGYYSSDTSIILDNILQKVADAGILVVTSAGNEGYDNDAHFVGGEQLYHFPSSFNQKYKKNMIAVAATRESPKKRLWKHSNYGKKHVDLAARGENVVSTYIDPSFQYQGDSFISLNGTSMAAAHISAVAADEMKNGATVNKGTIITKALNNPLQDTVSYGIILQ